MRDTAKRVFDDEIKPRAKQAWDKAKPEVEAAWEKAKPEVQAAKAKAVRKAAILADRVNQGLKESASRQDVPGRARRGRAPGPPDAEGRRAGESSSQSQWVGPALVMRPRTLLLSSFGLVYPVVASPGIYVSVPFCAQKCTYCNFQSNVYTRALRSDYIRFLVQELLSEPESGANTLYFGGGSPSLLEPEEFQQVASSLPKSQWDEATIEVAPGEATPDRVAAWRAASLNRASLGVQSFDERVAKASGRKHDAQTVASDVRLLADSGIRNISVDLIAGLAHQTEGTWRQSLEWVERIGPDHVSVYMLERDDDSRLGRELRPEDVAMVPPRSQSRTRCWTSICWRSERLRAIGYERYEISNFARAGRRSIHNLKYWSMQPYRGFGSDAHSFAGRRRWANVSTATEYVSRMARGESPACAIEDLDEGRLLEERLLTGLRTKDGILLGAARMAGGPAQGETARRPGMAGGSGTLIAAHGSRSPIRRPSRLRAALVSLAEGSKEVQSIRNTRAQPSRLRPEAQESVKTLGGVLRWIPSSMVKLVIRTDLQPVQPLPRSPFLCFGFRDGRTVVLDPVPWPALRQQTPQDACGAVAASTRARDSSALPLSQTAAVASTSSAARSSGRPPNTEASSSATGRPKRASTIRNRDSARPSARPSARTLSATPP